jgi:hypothetical protein
MIFKDYKEFLDAHVINENVQQAKIYLKRKALAAKKEKTGNEKETLSPQEVRVAETNPNFLKIKELLRDNPGYVLAFVKFFFEEEVPFEELKAMYDRIKEYRSVISTLPMPVERYADVVPDENDQRKGFERLGDDIAKLETKRIVKKFVDRLPGDFVVRNPNAPDRGATVPSIRRAYQNAPDAMKEKIAGIVKAFDEFGKNPDGTIDHTKNKELQDLFFDKIQRYRNLNEVIVAAQNFIKSANNGNMVKFMQAIQNTNKKFGELNGAEIVYEQGDILIIEIKSFQANKELNSNTSHCIASSSYQWDNYVGADSNFNKQYYIYNFALPPSDDKSVIGITIAPKYQIRACHTKSDAGFSNGIKDYMRKIGVAFEILAPMSDKEIETKKKRIIANKEIVKPNLSLENAKKYIEEGADPSAQQGKPLINSVNEDNLEKTIYLLEMGASPNIGNPIKGAKNLEMIKTLVSYGATVTNEVFDGVVNDYDGVKYLIDAGMNVNFEDGAPVRKAAKIGNLRVVKLLVESGADISIRRYMVVKWCCEFASIDILKYLLEQLEIQKKIPNEDYVADWTHWIDTSDKTDEKQQKETKKIVLDWFKKFVSPDQLKNEKLKAQYKKGY